MSWIHHNKLRGVVSSYSNCPNYLGYLYENVLDMLLAEGMNIKVLLLPDGEDPDSFARKHNATEFQQYIADHEENFIRFKTNLLMDEAKNDPIKRATLIADMAHSIGLIPNEIIRYECLKECAAILNVNEQIILNEAKKVVQQRRLVRKKDIQVP